MLDKQPPHGYSDPFIKCVYKLLRLLIDWVSIEGYATTPFLLANPDFNSQNIPGSRDGYLIGIIDWDGVAAFSRWVGNTSFPSCLTRNWDPLMCAWVQDDVKENLPEDLAVYRNMYAGAMRSRGKDARVAQNSLVEKNTLTAASN